MNIGEKVAYLKGLAEGLELDTESKNGKLIAGILDALESVAETIDELQKDSESISDYIDDLDEDLGEVEEIVYGEKSVSFPPHFKHKHHYKHDKPHIKHGYICDKFSGCEDKDDDDIDDGEDELDDSVEIKCPICGDKIVVEVDALLDNDAITCPNCEKVLTVVEENVEKCCNCSECSDSNDDEEDDNDDSDEQSGNINENEDE